MDQISRNRAGHSSDPEPLTLGCRDFVADALGGDRTHLTLEFGQHMGRLVLGVQELALLPTAPEIGWPPASNISEKRTARRAPLEPE
jgi:hypothetical protein